MDCIVYKTSISYTHLLYFKAKIQFIISHLYK